MKEGFGAILKFFLFLFILPLVIACALAFQAQILGLPVHKEQWILWGALAYVLCNFFLYNFKDVYNYGHKIVSHLCQFFEPLGNIAGFIVPIYTVLTICLGLMINLLGLMPRYEGVVLLLLSFSFTMHVVLSASQLYESDSHPVKGQYLCTFGLTFIIQVFFISLLLWAVIPEFSFMGFFTSLAHHAFDYYRWIYKALFVSHA